MPAGRSVADALDAQPEERDWHARVLDQRHAQVEKCMPVLSPLGVVELAQQLQARFLSLERACASSLPLDQGSGAQGPFRRRF